MTEIELPAPLVATDVDLRDFAFTPLFRGRLFGSSFHARVSDAAWRAGVTLWLKSWDQIPAGTLPEDEVDLCRLAELGRDVKAWRKIAKEALWGWFKCSDGRLHHTVVAQGVTEAWERKKSQRDRTAKARATRLSQTQSQGLKQGQSDPPTGSVTEPSTEPVTASKGQGQGQYYSSVPAAPYDPGAAAAASPVDLARAKRFEPADDGGTAEFRRVQAACVEALGGYLDTGGIAPADAHFGPMMAIVDQGTPLPAILTALRSIRARPPKTPIKTWNLLATKAAEQIAANQKAPEPAPSRPSGGTTYIGGLDVPTDNVRKAVIAWGETGYWRERWGEQPGRPGCQIPDALMGPTICLAGVDRFEVVVRRVLVLWRQKRGPWPEGWGPPPDDPDCAVPERLRPELEPA